jgi:hypothetical protein
MKHSPEFKKLTKASKNELIKQLAKKLWIQRNKEGRIIALEKEIALKKYSTLEMAYLLHMDMKIPDGNSVDSK